MLQEAEAYQASIVANAEGNAARFKQVLAEYQKAPAVTRDRMYLETMQQIFANTSKLMMDTKTGNNMIYLPLDKLISQTDSGAAKAVVPAPAPVTTSSEQIPTVEMRYSKDGRSRDSRDSRDREVR